MTDGQSVNEMILKSEFQRISEVEEKGFNEMSYGDDRTNVLKCIEVRMGTQNELLKLLIQEVMAGE